MINATVVVRARGEAGALPQCLLTVHQQLLEPGCLDGVVVVHDGDAAVSAQLDEWAAQGPGRLPLAVAGRGEAGALNVALGASTGDVVLFVDADSLLPPTALRSHLAVHGSVARVGLAGGPVGVHWPAGRPPGLSGEVAERTAGLDLGDDTISFPGDDEPVRANMSVRRGPALDAGGFDRWLDVGDPYPLSRHTFGLADRLRRAGWSTVYEPSAAIVVQIGPTALDAGVLRRRAFADGVLRARSEHVRTSPSRARRARRAGGELRAAARAWRRRRDGNRFGSSLPVILHGAAGLEFGRLTLRRS